MPCPEENTLGRLVLGTLSAAERAEVLLHVDECEPCRSLIGVLGASGTRAAPRASVEPAILHGTLFGRYMMLDRIGQGGMGVVHAAYDPVLDRRVAIKVLRAEGAEARARLLREGKAMARLSSPHVITVLDVGTAGDRDFVAMELVDGTTLGEWLRARARPWREVLDALIDAGRGLEAAHAEGLVHRDFKPDNVLVSRAGRVLVTDFGLARMAPEGGAGDDAADVPRGASTSTTAGGLAGTPAYMAPEQIAGATADARSDQFAFCVTCWEALGGVRPFHAATLAGLQERIREGGPARPERPFPPALRRVLERGLSADREKRHPSMTALLGDLERERGRSRKVRTTAVVVVLCALGLGAFGALRGSSSLRPLPVCQGAATKWVGVWDRPRSEAVRGAFAATGVPYAGDAFRGVDSVLGAYESSWQQMYTDTCEATRVRGEQSEEMMQLRMECLADRLRSARALTDLLASSPTSRSVEHAVAAAQELPAIVDCADGRTLRERLRPPTDPQVAARVAALKTRGAEVGALDSAGHSAEAVEQATPLAADAQILGYGPLEAETFAILGNAQAGAGDAAAAEASWKHSLLAAEACGHLEAQARAWTNIVYLDGGRLLHFSEAHEAAGHARALLRRLESPERLQAALETNEGITSFREGKFADARASYEHALAIDRRISPDLYQVGITLNALGRVLFELGDLAGCIEQHEQALALFERLLGPDHPNVAMAMTSIGNAYLRSGRYDDALERYRAALAIEERAMGEDNPETIATRDDVAAALLAKGDFDAAIRQLRESIAAIERQSGEKSPRLLRELDNLGIALQGKGSLEDAEAVLRRAVALAEATYGPEHSDVELALVNLADVLRERGKLDVAAAAYARAVAICDKAVGADNPRTAEDLAGLAFVRLAERRPADALPLFDRADGIAEKAQMEPVSLAKIRFGLARALWDTGGDRRRAQELAQESLAALKQSGDRQAADVGEVEQWLRAHRAGGA